ncbi:MAG: formyltetrahydrofolate deformylase, partial [Ktedonobacterales bacterium]
MMGIEHAVGTMPFWGAHGTSSLRIGAGGGWTGQNGDLNVAARDREIKDRALDSEGAQTITLLISCPDQPGIVAAVSRCIFEHGGNIIQSDQHSTSLHNGTFFMRISIAADQLTLSPADFAVAFRPIAERFAMGWEIREARHRKRGAILVSQQDHCLVDLLWRWKRGELPMDIVCIVSNHQELEPIAVQYGIAFEYLPMRREQHHEDQQRMLDVVRERAEFLILARYMQILEPFIVAAYPNRIINIHHSFLPAFSGANAYARAFERGVKLVGATAHYVTDVLDEGPIIAQDVIHCNHRDTLDDLVRKGRDVERRVLAEAVR